MHFQRTARLFVLAVTAIALAFHFGCAAPHLCTLRCAETAQARPALIRHVVLVTLQARSQREQLRADCTAKLADIPGVIDLEISEPVDIGRTNVDGDYDIAVFVSFASIEQYKAYLAHPNHLALVSAWKERSDKMRIYDFRCRVTEDPQPTNR